MFVCRIVNEFFLFLLIIYLLSILTTNNSFRVSTAPQTTMLPSYRNGEFTMAPLQILKRMQQHLSFFLIIQDLVCNMFQVPCKQKLHTNYKPSFWNVQLVLNLYEVRIIIIIKLVFCLFHSKSIPQWFAFFCYVWFTAGRNARGT